jgi:hypothetical protein
MLLMFVLALNMFGVFEIGTSATSIGGSLQSKQGFARIVLFRGARHGGRHPLLRPLPRRGDRGRHLAARVAVLPGLRCDGAGLALPYLVLSVFPS